MLWILGTFAHGFVLAAGWIAAASVYRKFFTYEGQTQSMNSTGHGFGSGWRKFKEGFSSGLRDQTLSSDRER